MLLAKLDWSLLPLNIQPGQCLRFFLHKQHLKNFETVRKMVCSENYRSFLLKILCNIKNIAVSHYTAQLEFSFLVSNATRRLLLIAQNPEFRLLFKVDEHFFFNTKIDEVLKQKNEL